MLDDGKAAVATPIVAVEVLDGTDGSLEIFSRPLSASVNSLGRVGQNHIGTVNPYGSMPGAMSMETSHGFRPVRGILNEGSLSSKFMAYMLADIPHCR